MLKYQNVYVLKNIYCLTQLSIDLGEPRILNGKQNFCYACCLGKEGDGVPLTNTDVHNLDTILADDLIIDSPVGIWLKKGITARYPLVDLTTQLDEANIEMFPSRNPTKKCRSLSEDGLCNLQDNKPTYCVQGGCLYARALNNLVKEREVPIEEFKGLNLLEKTKLIERLAKEFKVRIKI